MRCADLRRATAISRYPNDTAQADEAMRSYLRRMRALLGADGPLSSTEDYGWTSCIAESFSHELFYTDDMRERLALYQAVLRKAYPALVYRSPHLDSRSPWDGRRALRLGIASSKLFHPSSVMSDFGGTAEQLSKSFNVTLIHFTKGGRRSHRRRRSYFAPPTAGQLFVSTRSRTWVVSARRSIAALDLDVLLFLDSTMTTASTTAMMSRLAPVQACTHGHPVTTGLTAREMDYYVSWGGAELPHARAQRHYSERLLLLPPDAIHQWFRPINPASGDGERVSSLTGRSVTRISRNDLAARFRLPPQANWYVCLQMPFKLHPASDETTAGILRADPRGAVILLKPSRAADHRKVLRRMRAAGVDMRRVHWLSMIPASLRHWLLAMYLHADVMVDSYYAGGCTTTREILELGTPVVTRPDTYLGSRWTAGFYDLLGIRGLTATSAGEYVRVATRIATNSTRREAIRRDILARFPRTIYRSLAAVDAWQRLITWMAGGERTLPCGATCWRGGDAGTVQSPIT